MARAAKRVSKKVTKRSGARLALTMESRVAMPVAASSGSMFAISRRTVRDMAAGSPETFMTSAILSDRD